MFDGWTVDQRGDVFVDSWFLATWLTSLVLDLGESGTRAKVSVLGAKPTAAIVGQKFCILQFAMEYGYNLLDIVFPIPVVELASCF